jgi:hypothetical protein
VLTERGLLKRTNGPPVQKEEDIFHDIPVKILISTSALVLQGNRRGLAPSAVTALYKTNN